MSDWADRRAPAALAGPVISASAGAAAAASSALAPAAAPWHSPHPGEARELVVVNRHALRAPHGRHIGVLHRRFPEAVFAEPDLAQRMLQATVAGQSAFDRVIVTGGDGTLNRFLKPILEAQAAVTLVPAGTANDLAHEIGLAGPGAPPAAPHEREIDVLMAGSHPFITVGYLGFGSEVVTAVNRWRRLPWSRPLQVVLGKFIYNLGVLWIAALRSLPVYHLRITAGGRTTELRTALVVVANQPRVGGTMTLAHGTRNDDGSFRLLAFRHTGGLALLRAIAALCRGVEPAEAGVESFEAASAVVESLDGKPFLFCADGEELVEGPRLELGVHPRKLRLQV